MGPGSKFGAGPDRIGKFWFGLRFMKTWNFGFSVCSGSEWVRIYFFEKIGMKVKKKVQKLEKLES